MTVMHHAVTAAMMKWLSQLFDFILQSGDEMDDDGEQHAAHGVAFDVMEFD